MIETSTEPDLQPTTQHWTGSQTKTLSWLLPDEVCRSVYILV